jgi:hypothetical protein
MNNISIDSDLSRQLCLLSELQEVLLCKVFAQGKNIVLDIDNDNAFDRLCFHKHILVASAILMGFEKVIFYIRGVRFGTATCPKHQNDLAINSVILQ